MVMDHEDGRPGWVRLPGYEPLNPAGPGRADGVRRARRAANWTAAALIAGVAAATGYFAHHPAPAASTAPAAQAPPGGQVPVAGHAATIPGQAHGAAPVVTSGGSGVAVGSAPGAAGSAAGGTVFWRDN
jgi:hypothetical protein